MELEGKIWKNKNHWLVKVSSLNIMTQGETREEALFMIEDAIIEYMKYYFEPEIKGFRIFIQ
jgi:predicted RNase H-like HicB family nuclease